MNTIILIKEIIKLIKLGQTKASIRNKFEKPEEVIDNAILVSLLYITRISAKDLEDFKKQAKQKIDNYGFQNIDLSNFNQKYFDQSQLSPNSKIGLIAYILKAKNILKGLGKDSWDPELFDFIANDFLDNNKDVPNYILARTSPAVNNRVAKENDQLIKNLIQSISSLGEKMCIKLVEIVFSTRKKEDIEYFLDKNLSIIQKILNAPIFMDKTVHKSLIEIISLNDKELYADYKNWYTSIAKACIHNKDCEGLEVFANRSCRLFVTGKEYFYTTFKEQINSIPNDFLSNINNPNAKPINLNFALDENFSNVEFKDIYQRALTLTYKKITISHNLCRDLINTKNIEMLLYFLQNDRFVVCFENEEYFYKEVFKIGIKTGNLDLIISLQDKFQNIDYIPEHFVAEILALNLSNKRDKDTFEFLLTLGDAENKEFLQGLCRFLSNGHEIDFENLKRLFNLFATVDSYGCYGLYKNLIVRFSQYKNNDEFSDYVRELLPKIITTVDFGLIYDLYTNFVSSNDLSSQFQMRLVGVIKKSNVNNSKGVFNLSVNVDAANSDFNIENKLVKFSDNIQDQVNDDMRLVLALSFCKYDESIFEVGIHQDLYKYITGKMSINEFGQLHIKNDKDLFYILNIMHMINEYGIPSNIAKNIKNKFYEIINYIFSIDDFKQCINDYCDATRIYDNPFPHLPNVLWNKLSTYNYPSIAKHETNKDLIWSIYNEISAIKSSKVNTIEKENTLKLSTN